jgi:hypothetical protein
LLRRKLESKKIKQKIGFTTDSCLVPVGRSVSIATRVTREMMVAQGLDVPVFGVCVERTEVSDLLPPGLLRNRTVAWGWPAIPAMIEHAVYEEQNA